MERIVVGVDRSPGSREALRWAVEEGRARHCRVEAVHAWHVPSALYPIGLTARSGRHGDHFGGQNAKTAAPTDRCRSAPPP
jgi:nucleotide-binding universal stress UspA family protein